MKGAQERHLIPISPIGIHLYFWNE